MLTLLAMPDRKHIVPIPMNMEPCLQPRKHVRVRQCPEGMEMYAHATSAGPAMVKRQRERENLILALVIKEAICLTGRVLPTVGATPPTLILMPSLPSSRLDCKWGQHKARRRQLKVEPQQRSRRTPQHLSRPRCRYQGGKDFQCDPDLTPLACNLLRCGCSSSCAFRVAIQYYLFS